MAIREVRIAMNGVTGRMGYRQHLVRSILAIHDQGGIKIDDETVIWPVPILVGRNAAKLSSIAKRHDLPHWTTSVDEVLADPDVEVYFDAQVTQARPTAIRAALDANKHIYTEKPTAEGLDDAVALAREAANHPGLVTGVVQDKLFLPGLLKLRRLVESGFFGRILSVRGEFGYWVFEGDWQPAQRPSWNYRREDGGGMTLDMFPHWRYVLDQIIAPVTSVYAQAATHIPERVDEKGNTYTATADDAAYAVFELEGGIVAQLNSSWTTRVDRDELVEFHVDGTHGSAVAGLRNCRIQHRAETPMPVWNPDLPEEYRFREQWHEVPDNQGDMGFENGFKMQWEKFLTSVVTGTPFPWDLAEGAKGVQLAELGLKSWREGRKLEVSDLPQ